ncbi:MAG: sel1 repeat family protein [Rhodobacteraceae bacterium]|nr:sel1 repeat family protein [Paracoccaceae bacterium]
MTTKASSFFMRMFAEQGDVNAQYNVGVHYLNGIGVEQDYELAKVWLRKSTDQGDRGAQYNLAIIYFKGLGVPADYISAHMWFSISGAKGFELARKAREMVEVKMTPADISEAVNAARTCMASGYQNCR